MVNNKYNSNGLFLRTDSKYSHYFCYFNQLFHSFQHFSTPGEKNVFVISTTIMIKTTSKTLNFPTTTTLTMATSTSFPIVIMCCYIHLLEWSTISATSFIIFRQNLVILFCYKKVGYQVRIFFKSFFAILLRQEHIRCMKNGEYILPSYLLRSLFLHTISIET